MSAFLLLLGAKRTEYTASPLRKDLERLTFATHSGEIDGAHGFAQALHHEQDHPVGNPIVRWHVLIRARTAYPLANQFEKIGDVLSSRGIGATATLTPSPPTRHDCSSPCLAAP